MGSAKYASRRYQSSEYVYTDGTQYEVFLGFLLPKRDAQGTHAGDSHASVNGITYQHQGYNAQCINTHSVIRPGMWPYVVRPTGKTCQTAPRGNHDITVPGDQLAGITSRLQIRELLLPLVQYVGAALPPLKNRDIQALLI